MANQYTYNAYSNDDINQIVELYLGGMSFSEIGLNLKRKKSNIKEILINEGVWVDGRDVRKKNFTKNDVKQIINLYVDDRCSLREISAKFNISITPIKRILKEQKLLRNGFSNGKKIDLNHEQKDEIKRLYLIENKNSSEIGRVLGCSKSFVDKHISKEGYVRSRSEATKLSVTGRKVSKEGVENMKRGQKKLALSGNRKQSGGVCRYFNVSGLTCQGLSEKKYIEYLVHNNMKLPINGSSIVTPFGAYYPDFDYGDRLIEIKSTYTFDVLIGKKKSRWTNRYEKKQLLKIGWVSENIKPIDIVVVEKNKFTTHKLK